MAMNTTHICVGLNDDGKLLKATKLAPSKVIGYIEIMTILDI